MPRFLRPQTVLPSLLASLLASATVGPVQANAIGGLYGFASIGGEQFTLPLAYGSDLKSIILDAETPLVFQAANGDGDTLSIQRVEGNVDPFAILGVGFTDVGSPTSLIISLYIPLSPSLVDPLNFSAQLSGTLTDGGTDGVSITPFSLSSGLVGNYEVHNSVSGLHTVLGLGGPSSTAGPYGPFSASGTSSIGHAPYDLMALSIGFTGSGGGDVYSLVTRFDLNQGGPQFVPEPATLALLGLGLAGLAARRHKR